MKTYFSFVFRNMQGIFIALIALLLSNIALADTAPPQAVIEENSNRLIDAIKAQGDAIKQDPKIAYQLVNDIVLPHIDFTRVSRIVLGKYWRRASAEQRNKFQDEFTKLLVRTYVTAMVEFSDKIISHAKNVKFLPFRGDLTSEDVTVRMEIKLDDRPPVSVNYSLFENGSGWKIYDLSIEGVSLATTYRSSFASEIRRSDLDTLIGKLEAKNANR